MMLRARLATRDDGAAVDNFDAQARLDGTWRDVVIVERLIPANLD